MARLMPTTLSESPGNLFQARVWDDRVKVLNDFLLNRPAFRGVGQFATSVANNTWVAVPLAITVIDTDGGHNNAVNNSRYVCQAPGWYWVKGSVAWNPTSATGRIDTAIAKNGTIVPGSSQFLDKGANVNSAQVASTLVQLAVGNYVEMWARQLTGGVMQFDDTSAGTDPDLNAIWVHS